MNLSNDALTVILFVLSYLSIEINAMKHWCMQNLNESLPPMIRNTTMVETLKSCYFSLSVTPSDTQDTIFVSQRVFSLPKARQLCKQYQATLLTIHSEDEHEVVKRFVTFAPLGLSKLILENGTKLKVGEWDDNIESSFQPKIWHNKGKDYTFISRMGSWITYDAGLIAGSSTSPVQYEVVCKQNFSGSEEKPWWKSINSGPRSRETFMVVKAVVMTVAILAAIIMSKGS